MYTKVLQGCCIARDLTGKPDWDVSTGGEELLRTYDVYVLVLTITIQHFIHQEVFIKSVVL
jgi:hypothetical protein